MTTIIDKMTEKLSNSEQSNVVFLDSILDFL